ncbi:S-adenosyl-L-methionine-dependent methyltransferase [Boeremia exigua]|uniref:S-adenosyl-L-methionine-dependent methyltransferase n=1 Tax=Boeremia exigua TaxID=749465 RepID=UPI001E8DB99A|nr:S-adenosyl-L-methionine-dependent methyltransferase [Boeremia exigua]KAH6613886.1 S-adenosyl-L-methionine-dependent methyltransferase [Boeremia exigua]
MGDSSTPTKHIFDNGATAYEASTGGCTRDLARHMLTLSPTILPGSVIHDNACGTAVVAQEIVARNVLSQSPPDPAYTLTIHCTDKSANMIELARSGYKDCQSATDMQTAFPRVNVDFALMSSEELGFADAHFSHAFSNCGILWFDDAAAGAREMLRTLRPGGTVIASSWKEMRIFDVVRAVQRKCEPEAPPFKPPVDEKWFTARHLESVLREAGFEDVDVVERTVHFAGRDVRELCGHLMGLLKQLKKEWADGQEERFRVQLEAEAETAVETFERPRMEGGVEKLVGIPMVGLIGVAR